MVLNADLELANDKTLADGVMLITHGALAHRDMEFIVYLRKLFKEQGYNTLAINLSLGVSNRHGMYDCKITQRHRNDDAVEEIDLWVQWLHQQGVSSITLLGHSRGGAQTALYAAERDSDLIKAVVLLAPATHENTNATAYQLRYKQEMLPLLHKSKKLVSDGRGNTVLEHIGLMSCGDTSVRAETFVSYYGQDQRLDTPYLIPKIKKPLLIVVAGSDEVVVALDKKVAPLADGERVQVIVIDGADHFFRDLNTDDAAEEIDAFLSSKI